MNVLIVVERRPDFRIGRSMTETTEIPLSWVDPCMKLADEIWVPSSFLLNVFADKGIPRTRLQVVPIPIDVYFFDPEVVDPLPLPQRGEFNFLSVFKLETRKGWDVLLEGYWLEFKKWENTTLYLQTYLFGGFDIIARDPNAIDDAIHYHFDTIKHRLPGLQWEDLPRVQIISDELPQDHMPRLYKAADAFVLPTRGEGFGMPMMEAMAMGLPTIATNWSGCVDFMNEENAYLIKVESMQLSESQMGKWAEPSLSHLRQLMRKVFTDREGGRKKGSIARQHIVARYSQEIVGDMVVAKLAEIERRVLLKRKQTE